MGIGGDRSCIRGFWRAQLGLRTVCYWNLTSIACKKSQDILK